MHIESYIALFITRTLRMISDAHHSIKKLRQIAQNYTTSEEQNGDRTPVFRSFNSNAFHYKSASIFFLFFK